MRWGARTSRIRTARSLPQKSARPIAASPSTSCLCEGERALTHTLSPSCALPGAEQSHRWSSAVTHGIAGRRERSSRRAARAAASLNPKPTVSCPPDYVHQALSQRSLTGADYAARPGLRQFVVRPVKRRFRRILRFRVLWTPSPTLGLSRRRHAPARTRRLENGKPSLERMVIRAAAHRDPPVLTERAGASR